MASVNITSALNKIGLTRFGGIFLWLILHRQFVGKLKAFNALFITYMVFVSVSFCDVALISAGIMLQTGPRAYGC